MKKNGCVGTQRNVLRYDVNITWRVLEVVLIKVYSQQHRVMQYSVFFYNLGLLTGLKSVENVYFSSVNCHAKDFFYILRIRIHALPSKLFSLRIII